MKKGLCRVICRLFSLILLPGLVAPLGCQMWRSEKYAVEDERVWREKFEKSLATQKLETKYDNRLTTAARADARIPQTGQSSYLLAPGDLLEVVYHFQNEKSNANYQIQVNDKLKVAFAETPAYDSELTVRPDGQISVIMLGDLMVANKTATDVQSELEQRYSALLERPTISVQVSQAHTRASELKEAVTNSNNGQSQQMPVRPDGFISLPMLGDIKTVNQTPDGLSRLIQEMYSRAGIENVRVTVIVKEARSSIVYVLGDVMRQGVLTLLGPSDVWRMIAEAGGFTPEADRRQVVVARSTPAGERRYSLDFEKWRLQADSRENLYLQPGDVIFVPKTAARAVYLAGELVRPGQVVIDSEMNLTVSEAVALAGGVNGRGSESQILLLRRNGTEPLIVTVNLKSIFDRNKYARNGGQPPWDPCVQPGDIVYAPPSFVGSLGRFAEQWFRNGLWAIVPFGASANYSYLDGNTTSKVIK